VFAGDWRDATHSVIAYQAMMAVLGGSTPRQVHALFPDVGGSRTVSVAVDKALIDAGLDAAKSAVEVALARRHLITSALPRNPGPRCRFCPLSADCLEGSTWLEEAGDRRYGFLLTAVR
jgi:hypothetical protein